MQTRSEYRYPASGSPPVDQKQLEIKGTRVPNSVVRKHLSHKNVALYTQALYAITGPLSKRRGASSSRLSLGAQIQNVLEASQSLP